jgi:hypothetical protein
MNLNQIFGEPFKMSRPAERGKTTLPLAGRSWELVSRQSEAEPR